jgi:hypothetical protein
MDFFFADPLQFERPLVTLPGEKSRPSGLYPQFLRPQTPPAQEVFDLVHILCRPSFLQIFFELMTRLELITFIRKMLALWLGWGVRGDLRLKKFVVTGYHFT